MVHADEITSGIVTQDDVTDQSNPDDETMRFINVTIGEGYGEYEITSLCGLEQMMGAKDGVYFECRGKGNHVISISCLTGEVETIKPLDEKYLPDTIARVEDIPEIPDVVLAPLSAKPGQALVVDAVDENDKPIRWAATDLPEIPTTLSQLTNDAGYITADNIPEGFSGSYNDLTDKPSIPITLSQLTNDAGYITAADIPENPGGGSGTSSPIIIDVLELPTEGINEQVFYRLTTAKFIFNRYLYESFTCRCVDALPEVGEPVSTDMESVLAYYSIADGDAYGYVDEMLGAYASVPAGWYTLTTLAPVFNISWNGIIYDISDDPCDDSFRLLLSYDYYTFKDEWTKLIFASEKAPKFNITWDGDITDRPALDMSMLGYNPGLYFVKVSDSVFTTDELVGWHYAGQGYDGGIWGDEIYSEMIDTQTYPGAFTINGYIIVVYDADVTASALGIPTGIYTNGVYFWINTDSDEGGYVSNLTSPVRITKIDREYLEVDVDSLGLAMVATTGDYNHLYNRPTIYTDVVRYCYKQGLSSTNKQYARNNIDVYSKSEVDSKIGSGIDLSAYAKTTDVESMISNAIGSAIGGSY